MRNFAGIGATVHVMALPKLLGYSILKLDQVRRANSSSTREEILRDVEGMMSEAMLEIRTISKGMLLPEIGHLPLQQAIERSVRLHEARTKTKSRCRLTCP